MKTELKLFLGSVETKGLGKTTVLTFKKQTGINPNLEVAYVKNKFVRKFCYQTNKVLTNRKLNQFKNDCIKFLVDIKSYRGIRHKLNYPVRGQRTHTNGKTNKKKLKTNKK